MAKKITAIAGTTILAAIVIVGFAVKMLGGAWKQGGAHASEAKQVETNTQDIATMKPDVKANTEGRIESQANMEWIKGALKRIEEKP